MKLLTLLLLPSLLLYSQVTSVGPVTMAGPVRSSGAGAPGISIVGTPAQQLTAFGSSTVVFTMGATPTSGNCLVLVFAARLFGGTGITSVVDGNAHVTWAQVGAGNDGGSPMVDQEIWVGAVAASASTTQTVTYGTGSNANGRGTIYEVAGIPDCTATGKDAAFVVNTGSSAAPAIGSYTTTHANDIIFVEVAETPDSCNHLSGTPSGYTAATCQDNAGADLTQAAYQILSSSGSQTATWTTLSNPWITAVVAMKGN